MDPAESSVKPTAPALRPKRFWAVAMALVVSSSAGCGEDGVGAADPLADLVGTWRATAFRYARVSKPEEAPVDLIALGGQLTLEISEDGQLLMATREVGSNTSDTVLGSGRIIGEGRLQLDTGGARPITLDFVLAGDFLRLTGRFTFGPFTFGGEPEDVDLDAILFRVQS